MKEKLQFEEDRLPKASKLKITADEAVSAIASNTVNAAYQKAKEQNDDNAATEAAEEGGSRAASALKRQNIKQKRLNHGKGKKATQKQLTKKRYQETYRAARRSAGHAEGSAATFKGFVSKAGEEIKEFVTHNKKALLITGSSIFLILLLLSGLGSCTMMLSESAATLAATTYLSDDDDIHAAENQYVSLETALRQRIDAIESDHPGYDEYTYSIAEIGHNPYALISYLSARFLIIKATSNEIGAAIQQLYQQQYILSLTPRSETRYRTEERTRTRTDPITGETTTSSYTVQVPYTYTILNVRLQNRGIEPFITARLTGDQLTLYTAYQSTQGNRSYLFGEDIYGSFAVGEYADYTIPTEALQDLRFAALMAEATKYLGYPYVWGGSSPSTSFDCSGFVCWVLKASGYADISRTTAQGIYKECTRISEAQAIPGDLIFFSGTYQSEGAVSHIGIYVGEGMMLHCGNPIQYASIHSSYWQSHFYAFGRIQ